MLKIVVADEDRRFTEILAKALRERGYETVVLENAGLLPHLLEHQDADVLILDNHSRDCTSVEIVRQLNKREENTGWRRPAVILITDDDSRETEIAARLARVDFFVLKPCVPQELIQRVQQVERQAERKL